MQASIMQDSFQWRPVSKARAMAMARAQEEKAREGEEEAGAEEDKKEVRSKEDDSLKDRPAFRGKHSMGSQDPALNI